MPSIFAALDEGGRLLLARVYGGATPPQFPTVALLSSLVSYGENIGVNLQEISSDDVRIVFRRFDETLLVIVTNDVLISEAKLESTLQLVYNAVILLAGKAALRGSQSDLPMPDTPGPNVDSIKRLWRGSVTLIDSILKEEGRSLGLQLQMPEYAPTTRAHRAALDSALNHLVASASGDQSSSIAAAITWQGSFIAATSDWLSQHPTDLMLLQALVRSQPGALMRDIPVYLPKGNPEVPIRLLTADLTEGMELLLLAGQHPALSDLSSLVTACMQSHASVLKDVANQICLPASNTFPGFKDMDALIAVSWHPPRCLGITTAAAALASGASPFDDSFSSAEAALCSVHGGIIGSLASFCHSMAPLVPVGSDMAAEVGAGINTVPKFSTATEIQMMIPGNRLVQTGDRSNGLMVYAAFPASLPNDQAMKVARNALQALPTMQP